jgi:rubrerythrin
MGGGDVQEESKKEEQVETESSFHLASRVANYPYISQLIATGLDYYNRGKDYSPLVAFAELKIEEGIQYIQPKVEQALDSATYKETVRPVLLKADNLANTMLDVAEPKIVDLIASLEEKKTAYKESVDKLKGEMADKTPQEQTILLVRKAQGSLETSLATLNTAVSGSIDRVKDAPKDVRDKVNAATQDAIAALYKAIEVISKSLPSDFNAKIEKVKEELVKKEAELQDYALFKVVATNSTKLLNDISSTLNTYMAKGETIPAQIATTTYSGLHKVLENLISLLEHYKPEEKTAIKQE